MLPTSHVKDTQTLETGASIYKLISDYKDISAPDKIIQHRCCYIIISDDFHKQNSKRYFLNIKRN